MSFAVVHMQKISRGGVRGIQSHNQREKESRNNPDIDYSRSGDNYDLRNEQNINFNRRVNEIIAVGRTNSSKAVRKDAVVMCNFIISSDKAFFDGFSNHKQFFADSMEWFAKRYGAENIVNATVHLDETTPHMHIGIVPITPDGRLSANSLFDRKELTAIQTEFARDVGGRYGLQRGVEGSEKKHLSELRFKTATAAAELKEVQDSLKVAQEDEKSVQGQIQASSELLNRLEKQIQDSRGVTGSIADIDSVGKETIGGKITMSRDEAKALKSRAKAYYSEKYRADNAERTTERLREHYSGMEKEYSGLRKELMIVTSERNKARHEKKRMVETIASEPSLAKAYSAQKQALDIQEKKKSQKERSYDRER